MKKGHSRPNREHLPIAFTSLPRLEVPLVKLRTGNRAPPFGQTSAILHIVDRQSRKSLPAGLFAATAPGIAAGRLIRIAGSISVAESPARPRVRPGGARLHPQKNRNCSGGETDSGKYPVIDPGTVPTVSAVLVVG